MKTFHAVKAEMGSIKQQIAKTNRNKCDNDLNKVKSFCIEFCFNFGCLNVLWLKAG